MSNDTKATIFGIAKALISWGLTVSVVGVSVSNPVTWLGLVYGGIQVVNGYFTNKPERP